MATYRMKIGAPAICTSEQSFNAHRTQNSSMDSNTNSNKVERSRSTKKKLVQPSSCNPSFHSSSSKCDKATSMARPRINFNEKVNVLASSPDGMNKGRQYVVDLKSSKDSGLDFSTKENAVKQSESVRKKRKHTKKSKTSKSASKQLKRGSILFNKRRKQTNDLDEEREKELGKLIDDLSAYHPDLLNKLSVILEKPLKVRTVFPPVTLSKKSLKFLEGRIKRFNRHTGLFAKLKARSLLKSISYKPFEFLDDFHHPGTTCQCTYNVPPYCYCPDDYGYHDGFGHDYQSLCY